MSVTMNPEQYEAHQTRLREIRRQLIELSPQRAEALYKLRCIEGQIEKLCEEKYRMEYVAIKVTKLPASATGRKQPTAKPLDMTKAVAGLDKSQAEEMLKTLLRMQRELRKEEDEEKANVAHLPIEEEFPLEGYDPEDEEDDLEDICECAATPPVGFVTEGNLTTLVYAEEEYDSIDEGESEYACV